MQAGRRAVEEGTVIPGGSQVLPVLPRDLGRRRNSRSQDSRSQVAGGDSRRQGPAA